MLDTQTVGLAIEQMNQLPGKALLVTQYVNPNMAERLKQMDVPFLDTLGNAYLNAPPIFIYVKGHAPQRFPREGPTRAFVPAGLKVVYALLCRAGIGRRTLPNDSADCPCCAGYSGMGHG